MKLALMALVLFFNISVFASIQKQAVDYSVVGNQDVFLTYMANLTDYEASPLYQLEPVGLTQAAYGSNCYAQTTCPNGGNIYCETYGAGCTWRVWPYRRVKCEGYNNYGDWVYFDFHC